jgi:hypothetical protein
MEDMITMVHTYTVHFPLCSNDKEQVYNAIEINNRQNRPCSSARVKITPKVFIAFIIFINFCNYDDDDDDDDDDEMMCDK